jgi:copper chaperone CopZ
MTQTYRIKGMACAACASSVQQRLGKIAGVKEVQVSLEKKEALVTTDQEIKAAQVQEALKGSAYSLD